MKFEGVDKVCARLKASAASFLVLSIVSSRLFRVGDVISRFVWCTGGICPMISSKGAFLVVAFGRALRVYCANGSHQSQSF